MPASTPGRRAPSPSTRRQRPPSNRATKPSARRIEQQETEELLNAETTSVFSDHHDNPRADGSASDLGALIQLVADLKETIIRQSNIIEDVRAELIEIKAEQRTLKSQNLELQEEVRSLRTQLDSYSASLPSTRSWASVVAGGKTIQSTTSSSLATGNINAKTEPKCLRISTQARNDENDVADNTFTRYLPTNVANQQIRNALRNTDATKEVQVAGVGNTRTGYVIRFKDEISTETARTNTEWLEVLGNDTKLVKPRFGIVVHRLPTEGISLPENKQDIIDKITEDNDLEAKGYHIEDVAWLKKTDKPLGTHASLGMWFDTAEAAEWMVNNGLIYGQLYIGNVRAYKFEMKRCHNCLKVAGHLAWACKETRRCRHCGGEHDRRDCPPGTKAKCVDCNGPHPTGDKECRELATMNSRQ